MERIEGRLVQVEIYGQSYNLRGEGETGYIQDLASYVDRKMREVSEATATVDSLKVAILAALNIADEFSRYRKRRESAVGTWIEKTEEMSERLGRIIS